MIELIVLILGFFVALNLGANNTANCVGVAVGGRVLSYRQAMSIIVVFVILGAVLEGWKNMRTVGQGLIALGPGGANQLSAIPVVTIAILIVSGTWLLVATLFGVPVSISQSTVGAVFGAGLLLTFVRPDLVVSIKYGQLSAIAISWMLNPMMAALLGFLILKFVSMSLRQAKNVIFLNQVLGVLILISSVYSAYTLGASDVGTATGVIFAFFDGAPQLIALFGAVALSIGAVIFSRRVIYTVGSGITSLDPMVAFSAQFGSAVAVWSFVQFGMPVSSSLAIVSAIAGAGLVKGASTVSRRKLGQIVTAWILTPILCSLLTFAIGWLLLRI